MTAPKQTVIKGKSDLTKMQKKLAEVNAEVIDFMLSVVRNPEADMKLRTDTATKLATLYKETTESIVKESLAKLIATSKMTQGSAITGESYYAKPTAIADFNSIQKLDGGDYAELDEEGEFDVRHVGSFKP